MKKYYSFSISTLLFLSASVFSAPNLQQAAKDVCKCLEAPYEQAEKALKLLKQAQATGNTAELMSAQGEMMGTISASTNCFNNLEKKYQIISQSEKLQKEVMALTEKLCPNPITGTNLMQ